MSKISDKTLYAYNVYQIEGEGRKLFSKIEGDEDTIMGLPIKKIKDFLKLIMKKYFVIGNPIKHSLSPKLHNFWIKKKNINATYDKILATQDDLPKICDQIREKKLMVLI